MSDTGTIDLGRRASPAEARLATPLRRKADHVWPYVRGAALSVTCIWVFVITYLAFTPRSYVSRWTLNLPGATSNVSVSLDTIGQSTSTPSSPFSSSALSPKVVYKEIADGEKVRSAAAATLGLTLAEFGKPRVKLVDETALMLFETTAATPHDAKRKGDALIAAFDVELERLRNDELDKRATAVQRNLADYQHQARIARDNMLRAQTETGLVSTNQFTEYVTGLANLKRRLIDLSGETDKLSDEQRRLSEQLGVSAAQAGPALKLAADPTLQKVLADYTEAVGLFGIDEARYGPRHPQLMQSLNRRDAAYLRLRGLLERGASREVQDADVERLVVVVNNSARSELYATLVRNEALLQGRRRELVSLSADKTRLEADLGRLSAAAARLEELKKDQLVADAVLSSAMARLDSSKSDIYGSYPIVQVVATPDIAEVASQPKPLYAALGGLSGTFFACLAWMLAWLQSYHRWTHRKNVSSSG
jgi:uncharacterized protein involved in exopolysaccharide biosynthesis